MTKQRGPLQARMKVEGPYRPSTQEAWAYQTGRRVLAYANVVWKGEMITVRIEIPRAVPEPPR